jgi:hypothetical protein
MISRYFEAKVKYLISYLTRKCKFWCRVRDVLLVCKRWSTLCLQNPPQQQNLIFELNSSIHSTYLRWLAKTGKAVQKMDLHLPDFFVPRTLVSQTLSIIAITQPNMVELVVHLPQFDPGAYAKSSLQASGVHWDNFAGCLPLLSQLEVLKLWNVKFIPGIDEDDEDDEEDEASVMPDFFDGMTLKVHPPPFPRHPLLFFTSLCSLAHLGLPEDKQNAPTF